MIRPRLTNVKVHVTVSPAPRPMADGALPSSQLEDARSQSGRLAGVAAYVPGRIAPESYGALASVRLKLAFRDVGPPVSVKPNDCGSAAGVVTTSTRTRPRLTRRCR